MKRKKDTGKPVKPVYDVPADWWYLLPEKVSLRQIYDLCREDEGLRVEFWEEAGALEIEVPGEGSLDLEESPCDLGDEEGNDFLKEHGICYRICRYDPPGRLWSAEAGDGRTVRKDGRIFLR